MTDKPSPPPPRYESEIRAEMRTLDAAKVRAIGDCILEGSGGRGPAARRRLEEMETRLVSLRAELTALNNRPRGPRPEAAPAEDAGPAPPP